MNGFVGKIKVKALSVSFPVVIALVLNERQLRALGEDWWRQLVARTWSPSTASGSGWFDSLLRPLFAQFTEVGLLTRLSMTAMVRMARCQKMKADAGFWIVGLEN